jgi:iron-sulfur cluster repair protein YtfE (RIC family)
MIEIRAERGLGVDSRRCSGCAEASEPSKFTVFCPSTRFIMTLEFMHSHSHLTRLLEEIETHAQLLVHEVEDEAAIIEALRGFTVQFAQEIREHIREEETELFPRVGELLGRFGVDKVYRLIAEHKDIDELLRDILLMLEVRPDEKTGKPNFKRLDDYVRMLKYAFYGHSNHERLVLEKAAEASDLANERD